MSRYILLIFLGFFFCFSYAQESFPAKGLTHYAHDKVAIVNANIWINAKTILSNAKILIIKNKITAVGIDLKIPKAYRIVDMKSKYLYPSFLDLYSNYGMDTLKAYKVLNTGTRYWNRAIHPEYNACENFKTDLKNAKRLRSMGFGAVLSHKTDGIARGTANLISLGNKRQHTETISEQSAFCFSLKKGHSGVHYPGSYMGSIALLRQSLYDAIWYKNNKQNDIEKNQSLNAFINNWKMPMLMESSSHLDFSNIEKISAEFNLSFIVKGSGQEYKIIDEIKKSKLKLIVPI
ncbi:MAG TPA: hypothetical protein EYQ86_02655, partial [Bacteroidetes bacterium]|nr:hypothetical protein [Bacteroidota bacterium]